MIWSSRAGDLVGFGDWTGFIDLVVFRLSCVRLGWALGWIGTFGWYGLVQSFDWIWLGRAGHLVGLKGFVG